MENAVVRSTGRHSTVIGRHSLIGPNAHVVGCTLEECVFIATGASVFHGAYVEARCEVRVNGVVHTLTRLPAGSTVPIAWVAVGDPASVLAPDEHDAIWSKQKPLNFPLTVYGVERPAEGESLMPEVTRRLARIYAAHKKDKPL
jgi:carbonic anhydrase/acetyltransferase-like protein (isoleucine patch superfamily)